MTEQHNLTERAAAALDALCDAAMREGTDERPGRDALQGALIEARGVADALRATLPPFWGNVVTNQKPGGVYHPVKVSEAERLAQWLDLLPGHDNTMEKRAAAELRRLAAVERERNDYLQRLNNLHVNAQKCRADRDRLAAEVEALRADFAALQHAIVGDTGASAIVQAERLRADAERYRWLSANARSYSEAWGGRWSLVINGPAPTRHDCEDALDAAIDAAKKEGK